jgi:hypothetical protein
MDVPAVGASGGSQSTSGYVDLPPQPHNDVEAEPNKEEEDNDDDVGGYMEVGP